MQLFYGFIKLLSTLYFAFLRLHLGLYRVHLGFYQILLRLWVAAPTSEVGGVALPGMASRFDID